MKLVARKFAWLLPLVLCACAHNSNQPQIQAMAPPLEDTTLPPPDISPAAMPVPDVKVPNIKEPEAIPPEPVKEKPKHHKAPPKPSTASQPTAPSPAPAQVAEATPPPAAEESVIGKLETPPDEPDSRKQTETTISDVERGLNGLGRKLDDKETKISMQIRELLKEAKTDLATGDLAAADTQAKKARALLGELSQ